MHHRKCCIGRKFLFLLLFCPMAMGGELDDFAASLLCEGDHCPPPAQEKVLSPLVIEHKVLPEDAARGRDDQQAFLVRQGAYLTDQGEIASLDGEEVRVTLPERGDLELPDHGPADQLPTTRPVIITVPQGSSRG